MISIEQEQLSHFLNELHRAFENEMREISYQYTRPHFMYKIIPYKDGNQWCALLGENIHEGIVGFGSSAAEALQNFDIAYFDKQII